MITKEIIIDQLKNDLSEPNLQIFKNSVDIAYENDEIRLIVSDNYMKQWINTKCLSIIASYFPNKLLIDIQQKDNAPIETDQLELFNNENYKKVSTFNTQFTFQRFIAGNNSRFAYAAAEAVAKRPSLAYNPLYIYGSAGLGKTHLLHAIANEVAKKNLEVCLVTSEKFTNDLINSIRNKCTTDFKHTYRSTDVLLIDDIQFLTGKESTQEEFFHTFNELHSQNKQIVITSDCPPNDMTTLQDRLKTRFSWGLTVDIQPPELETRIAILRNNLDEQNLTISDDVLQYVASQIPCNIRELEGALNRITAYSNFLNTDVDITIASRIIKDLIHDNSKKTITIPKIKRIISSKFNLSIEELSSKKRTKDIALPRQIAMYLSREITNISLLKIGESFGNRDHTTVIHAIDKVKQLLTSDVDIKNIIEELTQDIQK